MELRRLSDEDLVEEARSGSDAAFAALYVRHQRAVHARWFAVLRDHDEAADASQNAMLNALRTLRRNRSPSNLRGWLLTIAHNEAVSLLRRTRPAEPLDHANGGAGPGADEGAFRRERLRQLVDDLNALPDRQRRALLLREASGYSYPRIASALGTSTGNARQTVHQARRNLHKRRVPRAWLAGMGAARSGGRVGRARARPGGARGQFAQRRQGRAARRRAGGRRWCGLAGRGRRSSPPRRCDAERDCQPATGTCPCGIAPPAGSGAKAPAGGEAHPRRRRSRGRLPRAGRRATLGEVSFPGTAKAVRFEPAD